jgi:hypothetical protein
VDTIVPVFVHEMATSVSTVVPVLADEITISAGTDFISTHEIATSVGTNMLVLANEIATFVATVVYVLIHKLATSVGTDLLVLAQGLLISEDTPAHDLYVAESTFVPSLACLLEISVFEAACVLLRNFWCQ